VCLVESTKRSPALRFEVFASLEFKTGRLYEPFTERAVNHANVPNPPLRFLLHCAQWVRRIVYHPGRAAQQRVEGYLEDVREGGRLVDSDGPVTGLNLGDRRRMDVARDGNNQSLIQGGYDICHMLEASITANNVAGMLVAGRFLNSLPDSGLPADRTCYLDAGRRCL
jgi:hypothetical protein